jgi:hypothetical protein
MEPPSSSLFMNQCTSATDLGYIHGQDFYNGTDIIAKHDTIFLGEETLEFFMAPTVKTH